MSINEDKYINALLYFLKYCNNKFLGKTKLNKLFYYLDFIYYRDNNVSITGDTYISQKFGPVPNNLETYIKKAKDENLIGIQEDVIVKNGSETNKTTFIAKEEPKMEVFNEKEKQLLENIKNTFTEYDTNQIVLQTHLEAPWSFTEEGQEIDYKLSNDIDFFK